jgi:hypothetical protein
VQPVLFLRPKRGKQHDPDVNTAITGSDNKGSKTFRKTAAMPKEELAGMAVASRITLKSFYEEAVRSGAEFESARADVFARFLR